MGGGVVRKQVPRWRRPRCRSERTPSITLLPRADGETEAGVGSPGSPCPQAVCPSEHSPHPGRYSFLSPSVPTSTPPRPPRHPPSLTRPCASQPTIGLPRLSPAPEVRKLSLLEGVLPAPPHRGKVRTRSPREVEGGPPLTSKLGTGLSQALGNGRDFHLREEGSGSPRNCDCPPHRPSCSGGPLVLCPAPLLPGPPSPPRPHSSSPASPRSR